MTVQYLASLNARQKAIGMRCLSSSPLPLPSIALGRIVSGDEALEIESEASLSPSAAQYDKAEQPIDQTSNGQQLPLFRLCPGSLGGANGGRAGGAKRALSQLPFPGSFILGQGGSLFADGPPPLKFTSPPTPLVGGLLCHGLDSLIHRRVQLFVCPRPHLPRPAPFYSTLGFALSHVTLSSALRVGGWRERRGCRLP